MSEGAYGRWAPPESPVIIEYSIGIMERIRALAADGFTRLARGGVEIGGVLFGTYSKGRVRIEAMRPVDCTYARSPFFILTAQNRDRFEQTLSAPQTEPELRGMLPVGWFVSHARPELRLSDTDREIHADHFPEGWQCALVLRPGRAGSTRAGFFVRNHKGVLNSDHSPLEFNLEPAPGPPGPAAPQATASTVPQAAPQAPPLFQQFGGDNRATVAVRDNRRWLLIGGWLMAVAGCAAAAFLYFKPQAEVPIALAVQDKNGEIRAEWNRTSPLIRGASRGLLEIQDGNEMRSVKLSPEQLAAGLYPFIRHESDVKLRLHVYNASGVETVEAARYLGAAVAPGKAAEAAGRLESENTDLRDELQSEKQKVRVLQKKVEELEDLLRIERNRSEVFRQGK